MLTSILLSALCFPAAGPAVGQADLVDRALGLEFAVLESFVRRSIASGSKTRHGLKIKTVLPHSSASAAGLRAGDILLEFAGQPLRNTTQLKSWITATEPGSKVRIKVARHRKVSILSRRPWKQLDMELQVFREEEL